MPLPTSYTEATFSEYLDSELGPIANSLGWAAPNTDDYNEVVNDTLLLYGESDIASITGLANIQKLRTLGMLSAWRRVVRFISGNFDFSSDGGTYSRSQAETMARNRVMELESEAAEWLGINQIKMQRVEYPHSPYRDTVLADRLV